MIRTIVRVTRTEGLGSALRRGGERIGETLRIRTMLARGAFATPRGAALLNVSAMGPFARLGGLPSQMIARLGEERALRNVALLYPGILEVEPLARRAPQFPQTTALFDAHFERAVRHALAKTGARAIHLEGASGIPTGSVLRLASEGIELVLGVWDFSLFCARPHLVEEPSGVFCGYSTDEGRCHRCLQESWKPARNEQVERRAIARQLLTTARAVVFPSAFLRDKHRELFDLPQLQSHLIEPAVRGDTGPRRFPNGPRRIAYTGSLKRHKGAHLLPEIISAFANDEIDWHIFGGGDEDLLRAVRRLPRTAVHGYHRGGTLPSLLARNGIDLGLLPSIWPETYCFALSELWRAGVPAVAFGHGAIAERITRNGGGWLAPADEGAAGIVKIVRRWLDGELTTAVPMMTTTPRDAAVAHVDLYRALGLID
jgi:glycosyltransferase involved in cell wall biosynthesis